MSAVTAALGTDARSGLSDRGARALLGQYGRNELAAEEPVPAWRRFVAQFEDILVLLLLVAAGISTGLWIVERETVLPYEAIAIFAVVLAFNILGERVRDALDPASRIYARS